MSIENLKKENIDFLFKELSKDIRKINGKYPPTEIVVVGGASILINYNFRESTQDIDVFNSNFSQLKQAINNISDKYSLNNHWLNTDFIYTNSFTPKLRNYAQFYKEYSNCVSIYTIKDEYLIAMKIVSARIYKNDFSDIVGILMESSKNIDFSMIDKAMINLYDGWEKVEPSIKELVNTLSSMNKSELTSIYRVFDEQQNANLSIIKDIINLKQDKQEMSIQVDNLKPQGIKDMQKKAREIKKNNETKIISKIKDKDIER